MHTNSSRMLLAWALALAVALAPMLPAFGAMTGGDHGDHAVHVGHTDMQANGPASIDSFYKHDNCNDRCCLACAMHMVNLAAPSFDSGYARSLQVPVARHYHSRTVVTLLDRPPRRLS